MLSKTAELFENSFTSLRSWFVLHTKSRQEKVVATELEASGVDCFLPLATVIRYYGKRKLKVEVPLFPGYVFLRGAREDAFLADRAKRLVNIIAVKDQEKLNNELKNLHIAVMAGMKLDPYKMLKMGVGVEVRSGPMRGMQGKIESWAKADRLILQVEMLGSAVSLEVDPSQLEVVN